MAPACQVSLRRKGGLLDVGVLCPRLPVRPTSRDDGTPGSGRETCDAPGAAGLRDPSYGSAGTASFKQPQKAS